MRKIVSCLVVAALIFSGPLQFVSAKEVVWETTLEDKMSWSQVTYFGTLLVGSKTSLSSYNPENGGLMWRREDFNKIAPFDVREMSGLPVIIINQDQGLGGSKTKLSAVSLVDGKILWETDTMAGNSLGAYSVPSHKLAILFRNVFTEAEDNGLYIFAYDVESGELKWKTLYQKKPNVIQTHLADNVGMFYVRNDFSGHHEPVVDGDHLYAPFAGVHCFDLLTGNLKWEVSFKTAHKTLKKAYAPILIEEGIVYATGEGVVYAIDQESGRLKWKSPKVPSGLIAQLIVAEDMVLARLGGNFYNQGAKAFKLDKPLGVVAFNKQTGKMLWEFKGAKESITNLVYLPGQNTVMFADANSLIGIDAKSAGQVKETFKLPLEFKRNIGVSDVASTSVKTLTGGIGGLVRAGAKMAIGKDRKDPPVAVTKQPNGSLVVRGRQHLLAFDPSKQEILWSTYYAAPGSSGFEMAIMTTLTALSVLQTQFSSMTGYSSSYNAGKSIERSFQSMDKFLDRRFSKTQNTERYSYILTRVSDGEDAGIGIMAIDMETGEPGEQIVFDEKDPEYKVDDMSQRVYHFKGKKNIVAYDLGQ